MKLTLEAAEAIADAAIAAGTDLGKALSVAIVDAGGFLKAVKRADGARPLTPNIAISKAYSSAVMERPTTMLKAWAQSDPAFFATLSRHGTQPTHSGYSGTSQTAPSGGRVSVAENGCSCQGTASASTPPRLPTPLPP